MRLTDDINSQSSSITTYHYIFHFTLKHLIKVIHVMTKKLLFLHNGFKIVLKKGAKPLTTLTHRCGTWFFPPSYFYNYVCRQAWTDSFK